MGKKSDINKDLARLIEGKTDPMQIARIVADWKGKQTRKRNTQAERREWMHGVINNVRKLSQEQMTGLVWEFAMHEAGVPFASWLGHDHPELFKPAKTAENSGANEGINDGNDNV